MLLQKSKRLFLAISFMTCAALSAFSQNVGDYRSILTGSWTTATNWERCATAGTWVGATNVFPPIAGAGIGVTVTIQAAHTITATGVSIVNNSILNIAGTLTIPAGRALTNTINGNISNSGTLNINTATSTFTNNNIFTNTGSFVTLAGATITNSSTGTFTQSSATAITCLGNFTNSGFLSIAATRTFNNGGVASATFTNNSTGRVYIFGTFVNIGGVSNKILNNGVINNLTGGIFTNSENAAAAVQNTSGSMFINSATINNTPGANCIHFDNGSKYQHYFPFTAAATGTIPTVTWNAGSICEIRDCGSGSGGPTFTAGTTFSDFIWADTNQVVNINLNGKLTVGRNITIRHTGTRYLIFKGNSGGSNAVFSGNFTVETDANLTLINSSGTFASGLTIDVAGNLNQTGGIFNLTTSTTTISTSPAGNAIINVAGNINVSNGTLTVCSSAATSTQANGTINVTGSTNISGGTLNLNASTTTGGGGLGVLNLSGNFVHTGGTISKTAAAAANTGTINIIGTLAQTIESTSGFAANTIAFNITQTTASGLCSILATKTFAVNSGTTVNINDNTSTGLATNPELTVLGNISVGGTGIINVNALAKLDMRTAAMTGTGTFNLATTATLLTQHAGGISTTAATGCIQTTTKTFHANANYYYNGTAAQVTGNALPTALTDTLTINNTSTITTSGVTLTQATGITGNLRLINGRLITTSALLITIGSGGTSSSGSITSFVDGPINKIGNTAFVFPTGDVYTATGAVLTAKWARIELVSGLAAGNSYTAEYHKLNDPCNVNQAVSNTNGAGINHVSYKEYWDMTRVVGASTPVVKLYWEDNSESSSPGSAISSAIAANLIVAEFYTATWNAKGAGTITTAGISGTITTGVGTTFTTGTIMPFTFGAPTLVNPLPIELTTFTGYPTSDGNQLEWSTATETNNNYFDVERSADGAEFTKIASVNGNGNSTSTLNYNLLDPTPASGINYYRLKQVDFDGNSTYSNIISIEDETWGNTVIQVYPNPSNDIVHIIASENIVSFSIYNMLGELVFTSASDQNNIQFNPISKGIYLIKAFTQDGKVSSARFVRN